MKKKFIINSERTKISYVLMNQIMLRELKTARENNEGRYFNCIVAMVFSAFCLEAYFNHLGHKMCKDWDTKERLTHEKKLDLLIFELELQIDKDRGLYQTMQRIFRFRDGIAHAKTEIMNEKSAQISDENPILPQTEWEKEINLDNAEKYIEDARAIIYQLHQLAFGPDKDPFVVASSERWGSRPLENNNKSDTTDQ